MRKLIYFIPIFLFLLNCTDEGELIVSNKTNGFVKVNIEGTSYQIEAGNSINKTWELSSSIFSSEEKTVSISGEGLFLFRFNEQKTIKPGETTNYNLYADAGAISFTNNSSVYIKSIYLSPSSDDYWGADDLSGTLYPGETIYWRVSSGYWDIKVVDQNDISYESYNHYIGVNELLSLSLSSQTQNSLFSGNKKIKEKFPLYLSTPVKQEKIDFLVK